MFWSTDWNVTPAAAVRLPRSLTPSLFSSSSINAPHPPPPPARQVSRMKVSACLACLLTLHDHFIDYFSLPLSTNYSTLIPSKWFPFWKFAISCFLSMYSLFSDNLIDDGFWTFGLDQCRYRTILEAFLLVLLLSSSSINGWIYVIYERIEMAIPSPSCDLRVSAPRLDAPEALALCLSRLLSVSMRRRNEHCRWEGGMYVV